MLHGGAGWEVRLLIFWERDYVIFLKVRELAHYLVGKQNALDLISPDYEINRNDTDDMRISVD